MHIERAIHLETSYAFRNSAMRSRAYLAAWRAAVILATRFAAIMPCAAFFNFLVALYFLRFWEMPGSGVADAVLPETHELWMTCSAVSRFLGSTVSNPLTRSFASLEIGSHHGEGKSYLQSQRERQMGHMDGTHGWDIWMGHMRARQRGAAERMQMCS